MTGNMTHSTEEVSAGNNSEIQCISIRDHAVSYEDITDMANKILHSPTKKFSIEFCDCDLTADHLKYLCEKIKDAHFQITTFTISYMDNFDELLEKTCFIILKYETTNLSLEYNELSDESLYLLARYLEDKNMSTTKLQVEHLDISYNSDISAAGFDQLGKILKNFNIVSLKATDCEITDEKLKKLLDALRGVKLKELNISCNEKLTDEGFRALAEFVADKSVDCLRLKGCKLIKENIDVFHESLQPTGRESSLEEFDVSYNSTIEPETSIGAVIVKCGVTKLSVAGCKLTQARLVCLRKSMENHKMDLVNMRDNTSISQGIEVIADLVRQCEVKELNICDCMFSAQNLERFRKALDGTQVDILHLGDQRREPDKKYVDELCALMANVKDVLYLWFRELSDDFRTCLQNSCKHSAKINLTVGGKEEELCGTKIDGVETQGMKTRDGVETQIEETPLEALKKKDSGSLEESSSTSFKTKKWQTEQTVMGSTDEMLQEYLPTSSEIKEFKQLNLEQPMIGSTKKMQLVESTEKIVQEDSSTSKNMSSSTEDIEVIFKCIVSKILKKSGEFREFALSKKGLHLDMSEIRGVIDEASINIGESQKMAVLHVWREKEGPKATLDNIRKIVRRYFDIGEEDIEVVFENEITKIFEKPGDFIMFAQSKKGLHLDMSDIQAITGKGSIDINESQKMAVLKLWREKNEPIATPVTIREIVKQYLDIGPEDILNLCDGRVRMFRNCQLRQDIEAVFKNEITRIFKDTGDFIMFAQSEKGLHLDISDIHAITGKGSININESQKMAVLKLWREKNEPIATPVKIREIVKQYIDIGSEDNPKLCDERVRLFRNCQLRQDWITGDVFLGEMSNITRHKFCAVRRESHRSPIPTAAKLLDKKHENLVSILDVDTHYAKQFGYRSYIVSELTWIQSCEDIFKECDRSNISLREHTALNFIKQYLLVFDFLHSNDICWNRLDTCYTFVPNDIKKLKLDRFMFHLVDTHNLFTEEHIVQASVMVETTFSKAYEYVHSSKDDPDRKIKNTEHFRKLDLGNLPINKKNEVEELTKHMRDRDPGNSPTAIQVLADITFFKYPFKDAEDKPAHILVQCRKKLGQNEEEFSEWISDETENFNLIGEPRTIECRHFEDVISVIIRDREVTEHDIPTATRDKHIYSFGFLGCHITNDFLNLFYEKMDSEQEIESLKVTHMKPGSISGLIEMICSIIEKWEIKRLSLEHNYMSDVDIDMLQKCLRRHEIRKLNQLDISFNKDISSDGFQKVGELMRKCSITSLLAKACDITDEKLEKLLERSREMLAELDLSYNPGITPNTALGSIIKKCNTLILNLAGCEFTEQHFIHMKNTTARPMLRSLCLRDNKTISGGLGELAELVKHWNLYELDLGDCMLTVSDLRAFRKKLDGGKLRTLRLNDNKTISGGLGELAEIVKHGNLCELDLGDCMLTDSDLRAFRVKLNGAKIGFLYLGDKMRELDACYMEEIVKLRSNARKSLSLQCHKLNCDFRQVLKNHSGPCLPVSIEFSDGTIEKWRKYDGYTALRILKKREVLETNHE